jgi:hypothetical protein
MAVFELVEALVNGDPEYRNFWKGDPTVRIGAPGPGTGCW